MNLGRVVLGLAVAFISMPAFAQAPPLSDDPGVVRPAKLPMIDDEDPKAPGTRPAAKPAPTPSSAPAPPVAPAAAPAAAPVPAPAVAPVAPPAAAAAAAPAAPSPAPPPPPQKLSRLGLGLAIGGGAIALGMAGLLIDGSLRWGGANNELTLDDRNARAARGRTEMVAGGVGLGVGVIALGIGVISLLPQSALNGDKLRASAWVSPEGGGLVAAGSF